MDRRLLKGFYISDRWELDESENEHKVDVSNSKRYAIHSKVEMDATNVNMLESQVSIDSDWNKIDSLKRL